MSAGTKPASEADARKRTEKLLEAFHAEPRFGKAYDLALYRRLWPFFRPYRRLLVVALGVVLVSAGTALARPLLMRYAIDAGIQTKNWSALLEGGLVLTGVILCEQALGFFQLYATQIVGARALSDLRGHVFAFLHRLRLSFFDKQLVGRLVSRVTNDVDSILELFGSGALLALGDLVKVLGIVVLMLLLDWKLALIGFAAIPPVMLIVLLVRGRMRETFRDIRAKTSRMNATMNEQVHGMTVIQAYGKSAAAAREFDAVNVGYRDANLRAILWDALQDASIDSVAAICLASIIVSLGYREVSFGTVVAFSAYLTQFFEPITTLAQRYTLLQSAMAGAERVFGLLDVEEPDCPARLADALPVSGDSAIEFESVSFAYKQGFPVLRDVSITVKRGEKLALVGPTGSGKTTVTALLMRLYEVDGGVVRVNGRDARSYTREELRREFAVVPQDVVLFPGTIASNIAIGESPDEARVEAVLRRIGAWDLIVRRKEGIHTRVDELGANFSVGERQLIAFARALYRDAPILILDEATANIDSQTEAQLQRALEEVLRERTAIIIAHRLSTVRAADRIAVFQKGCIVEQGSHAALLRNGGLYARLYALQFARIPGELTTGSPLGAASPELSS